MTFKRLRLSRSDAHDAARLGVQAAIAAAGTYVAMQLFGLSEYLLGIISAVFVVQRSLDNTLRQAVNRIEGAFLGSVIGIACLLLLPVAYGAAAALALSMLLLNAFAAFRPSWQHGAIAAVALSLRPDEGEAIETIVPRLSAIGIGVLVGAISAVVAWPETASARADKHLRRALIAIAGDLDTTSRIISGDSENGNSDGGSHSPYHFAINQAEEAAGHIRFRNADALRRRIEHVERLYNSVVILNRVAEEGYESLSGVREYRADIDALREQACAATRELAGGAPDVAAKLAPLEEAFDRIYQAALKRRAQSSSQHIVESGLLFGLHEIVLNLRALCAESDPE